MGIAINKYMDENDEDYKVKIEQFMRAQNSYISENSTIKIKHILEKNKRGGGFCTAIAEVDEKLLKVL